MGADNPRWLLRYQLDHSLPSLETAELAAMLKDTVARNDAVDHYLVELRTAPKGSADADQYGRVSVHLSALNRTFDAEDRQRAVSALDDLERAVEREIEFHQQLGMAYDPSGVARRGILLSRHLGLDAARFIDLTDEVNQGWVNDFEAKWG